MAPRSSKKQTSEAAEQSARTTRTRNQAEPKKTKVQKKKVSDAEESTTDRLQPRSFSGLQPVGTAYGRNQSRPVETGTDQPLAASFMPVGGPRAIAQGLPNEVVVVAVVVGSSLTRPSSRPSPPHLASISASHPSSHASPRAVVVVIAVETTQSRLLVYPRRLKVERGPPPAPPSPGPAPNPPPASPGLDIRMLPIYGAYAVRVLPVAGLTRPEDDSKSSSYRRRLRVERRQRQRRLEVERDSHRCRLAVEQRRGGGRK
ncbi:hypothetical protein BDZ89DRAFT_1051862 [Hymenopellis radicata]|nr:hypothetical protein BDZ89DRAFT_1051862 [Hymenopellis radicata]